MLTDGSLATASHTLNLVAVHDADKAMNDLSYKKICRATMAKCSALWNKASRSTQCADVVSEKMHTTLLVPNDTRWNSYFNAMAKIKHIIEQNHEETVSEVFSALEVLQLRENEVSFVNEYYCVMHPLACALDMHSASRK